MTQRPNLVFISEVIRIAQSVKWLAMGH